MPHSRFEPEVYFPEWLMECINSTPEADTNGSSTEPDLGSSKVRTKGWLRSTGNNTKNTSHLRKRILIERGPSAAFLLSASNRSIIPSQFTFSRVMQTTFITKNTSKRIKAGHLYEQGSHATTARLLSMCPAKNEDANPFYYIHSESRRHSFSLFPHLKQPACRQF